MPISKNINLNKSDRKFLNDAMKVPMLSREEERELAQSWIFRGDKKSMHKIIQAYSKLVIAFSMKFKNYGLPISDLVQEGHIGLMQAMAKFEPDRDIRFSTYASWWIRQSVSRYVSTQRNTVRIPSHAAALAYKVKNLIAEYEEELGIKPTVDEMAEVLGVTSSMIELSIESLKLNNVLSLDAIIGGEETGRSLGESIEDDSVECIDTMLDNEKIRGAIISSLSRLSKREEQVLRLRFGISEVNSPEDFEIKEEK